MLWWLAVKKGAASAWAWLKKYWVWVVGLLGGLVLFLAGRFTRKAPDVIAPELLGHVNKKIEVDEEAERKKEEAKAKLVERVSEIKRDHDETIEHLDDKQKERMDELLEDPDDLNSFLLEVGKSVREN